MGVTLSRRVLKGGLVKAAESPFDLGPPLTPNIDNFLGLAGANYGLINCGLEAMKMLPVCSPLNGFYPGTDITPYC